MLRCQDSNLDKRDQNSPGCRLPHTPLELAAQPPYRCRMPVQSILRDRAAVTRAVRQSRSIAEALQTLGLRPAGGNYRALHQACGRFGLDVPVYVPPRAGTGRQSRLPGSNGLPAAYRAAALPDELRRQGSLPAPGSPRWLPVIGAVLIVASLAAGSALALAIRDGSRTGVAESAAVCLLMLLAILT